MRRDSTATAALACAALIAGLLPAAWAQAEAGDPTGEHWDLYARFGSGEHVFVRMMITDEGPGDANAVTTGVLLRPDGDAVPLLKGKTAGGWSRSDDGARLARLDIGKSELDRRAPEHVFRFGSSKYGVDLELRWAPSGAVAPGGLRAEGYASDLLEMGAPVTGWYRLEDVPGRRPLVGTLALVHTSTWAPEAEVALRRIEHLSLGEDAAFYLTRLEAPDGERARWLALRREGEIAYVSSNFELEAGAESPDVADPGYPFPHTLRIRNERIRGTIRLANRLRGQDLLDGLPLPIRMLLTLRMRPHRVWVESPYEVELAVAAVADPATDVPPFELRGTGITSVTFLNPLK